MILSIIDAAKHVSVSRATLYAMQKRGTISFVQRKSGGYGVDTSELSRVFTLNMDDMLTKTKNYTNQDIKKTKEKEPGIPDLKKDIVHLQETVDFLKQQLFQSQSEKNILLEISKNNSEQLLLTHQLEPQSLWHRLFGK